MVAIGSKLRLAIIGVGGWGNNHARILHDLGVLSAICDMDELRAKELADRYDVKSYNSVDEMLKGEKRWDACLIGTPTNSHCVFAKKIMER